jgi:hypothetical protein
MQTFVTFSDPNPMVAALATAPHLDSQRLGKQRVEAKQIITALLSGKGWFNHPATKMWSGHVEALALYGHAMCSEWIQRGFADTLRPYFFGVYEGLGAHGDTPFPWWFGHQEMVVSHRSKLFYKNGGFYSKFWPLGTVVPKLPYLWPSGQGALVSQGFYLSAAEAKRGDFELLPHWRLDSTTRRVTFA